MASGCLHTRASDVGRLCRVNAMVAAWQSRSADTVLHADGRRLRNRLRAARSDPRLALADSPYCHLLSSLRGPRPVWLCHHGGDHAMGRRPFFRRRRGCRLFTGHCDRTAFIGRGTDAAFGWANRARRPGKTRRDEVTTREEEANSAVPVAPATGPLPWRSSNARS
jgi:hypothetical protein